MIQPLLVLRFYISVLKGVNKTLVTKISEKYYKADEVINLELFYNLKQNSYNPSIIELETGLFFSYVW